MKTTLRSASKEITIDTDGPVIIIGEKINPTRRKKLGEELKEGKFDIVRELTALQIAAGADVLDINVGVPGVDEVSLLAKAVKVVAEEVDAPLCIDSPNPDALAAALAVTPGKPIINSVNGEKASLEAVLPVVAEYKAAVIGLTMDDSGIPHNSESRLEIAGKILEEAAKYGIPAEDVVIDPLVMSIGADTNASAVTLQTIRLIRQEFGVNITMGASNVSFGLPDRSTINQTFMALAINAGVSCAITDPVKLTSTIRSTDLLLGRDDFASRFIAHFRAQQKG